MRVGDRAAPAEVEALADTLVQALEMAAGLRAQTDLLSRLTTAGTVLPLAPEPAQVLSFSGGVADCIGKDFPWRAFGDMGPELGRAIRNSRLCRGDYRLGAETIRATVIGAGCHSTQLSGSTVFYRNLGLPLKNLPAVRLSEAEQSLPPEVLGAVIQKKLGDTDQAVLALPGFTAPHYGQVIRLAEGIARGFGKRPVLVCLEADMAKALGQALALRLPPDRGCLCIDRVRLEPGSYLDIGAPVGPALPVVVKTLIL